MRLVFVACRLAAGELRLIILGFGRCVYGVIFVVCVVRLVYFFGIGFFVGFGFRFFFVSVVV